MTTGKWIMLALLAAGAGVGLYFIYGRPSVADIEAALVDAENVGDPAAKARAIDSLTRLIASYEKMYPFDTERINKLKNALSKLQA